MQIIFTILAMAIIMSAITPLAMNSAMAQPAAGDLIVTDFGALAIFNQSPGGDVVCFASAVFL